MIMTVSPRELSVLCAVDVNLAVGGARTNILFGLIGLGLVREERTFVLTDAGREIVDRHFPPDNSVTDDERIARIRRDPQTDNERFLMECLDYLSEQLEQGKFNMNCMREFGRPTWMNRG